MAPSIRGICEAPCPHLVAARHARVERIFGNVDTQYPVDHCPILPLRIFSKSSASNNLVRRIYARARPRIPSDLNSGAWKTGPNLPHRLYAKGTQEAHRSPRCSAKRVYSLSSLQRTRDVRFMARPPPRSRRALLTHRAPALDSDEKPLFGPRMQDAWERQVPVGDRLHSCPR